MASLINTELPREGKGYYPYNRDGDDQYGTPETIAAIKRVCEIWALANSQPVYVGDISRKGGRSFAPTHAGHTKGREVDIRPVRADGKNLPVTWRDAAYSRALTKQLIQLFWQHGGVEKIFFNDPVLIKAGLCVAVPGHDNHLHIRLAR